MEQPYCTLCRKPLPRGKSVGQKKPERQNESEWMDCIQGICPFCMQEAKAVRIANQLKSVSSFYPNPFLRSMNRIPVVCALEYSGYVRTAIRHFKYDGMVELVPWFTFVMCRVAQTRQLFSHVDCVTHVPASRDRINKRGYDQAYLLARSISRMSHVRYLDILNRSEDADSFTQSQTAKSAVLRKTSLQGKFQCNANMNILQKRILLVDDVITTGSTVQACAKVLLKTGAKSVAGLVIAYVR